MSRSMGKRHIRLLHCMQYKVYDDTVFFVLFNNFFDEFNNASVEITLHALLNSSKKLLNRTKKTVKRVQFNVSVNGRTGFWVFARTGFFVKSAHSSLKPSSTK